MRRILAIVVFAFLIASLVVGPVSGAPRDVVDSPAPAMGDEPPSVRELGDGEASVSSQTGDFTYRYDIAVPPGRRGMQPSLSLGYSSQGAVHGGVAQGWTLSIPEIRRDLSRGRLINDHEHGPQEELPRFTSSLAGGAYLIPVTEPTSSGSIQTYRAQRDTSYTRYRYFDDSNPRWEAYATSGTTYVFGEADHMDGVVDPNRAVLTRQVDEFGNTVDYYWNRVEDPYGTFLDLDIDRIEYTSNANAGLGPHAWVTFVYDTPQYCPSSGIAIGARLDVRDGTKRYAGTRKLLDIRSEVLDPDTGQPRLARKTSLRYDIDAESCTAEHSPMRLLTTVWDTAYDSEGNGTSTRPAEFTYGPLTRTLDHDKFAAGEFGWDFNLTYADALAWGYREYGHRWPTIESMLVDLDGDGRDDLVYMDDVQECVFRWKRNTEAGFDGGIGTAVQLPTMPWADGVAPGENEGCSLTGQFTQRATFDPPGNCGEDNMGTYLAYRFMDLNSDGLTDLVTAIHHDWRWYDPNVDPYYSWDPCVPNPGLCPDLDQQCMDDARVCPDGDWCGFDEQLAETCLDDAVMMPCEGFMLDLADGHPLGDVGGDPTICSRQRKAHERCGQNVWMVHWNQGDGVFDPEAEIKLQPTPLESNSAESSLGSSKFGMTSGTHAIMDLDGDGNLDIGIREPVEEGGEPAGSDYWWVYRGDGDGNFEMSASGLPYLWYVPANSEMSTTSTGVFSPSDDRWVAGNGALMDMNADGLPDLVWRHPDNDVRPYVYLNDGTRFLETSSGALPLSWEIDRVSRSVIEVLAQDEGFVTEGKHHTRLRAVDFDGDGRQELIEYGGGQQPSAVRMLVSAGDGTLLSSIPLDSWDETYMNRWVDAEPNLDPTQATWAVTRDYVDLDGDGRADYVYFDSGGTAHYFTDPDDGMPVRLMHTVDNGVGKTTHIRYEASSGMPNHTWVVSSMERIDAHSPTAAPSLTTYEYFDPEWNADEDGKFGFRGFARTETTTPTGALKVNLFDYDVDWTGRNTESIAYADAGDPDHPHMITRTDWSPYTLFGGAVTTFHKDNDRVWRCNNGDTYNGCIADGAFSRTSHDWVTIESYDAPGEPLAHVRKYKRLYQHPTQTQDGDRRDTILHRLHADDDRYYLREYDVSTSQRDDGVWTKYAKTRLYFDADGLVPEITRKWTAQSVYLQSERTYDMTTGNVVAVEKPAQRGTGIATSYVYDDHELYVVSTLNELGQIVNTETDWATGVTISTVGPNTASCGGGCEVSERTDIVIDGFGRTLEAWVSVDDPVLGYRQELVGKTSYFDGESPQRVRNEALIDYGGSEWVTSDTLYDGHGRVVSATTLLFDPALPDATTSYTYDEAGRVVVVEVPSPQNDSATVTYEYAYDSLGRPTALREPGDFGLHVVGIDMSYDGLVRTRTEVVVDGQAAETRLVYDVYERLREVHELLDDGTYAVTTYEYDANDNLHIITDAEGHSTQLDHDWLSRRTAVTRAGQTWQYQYDDNGNRTKVISPVPGGELASLYTTSLVYDDLDRVESVVPAVRDLSPGELSDFMIGTTDYTYDVGINAVGRLSTVAMPHGSSTYEYTASGQVAYEQQSFTLGPIGLPHADTRDVSIAYNALGQPVDVWHADGMTAGNGSWTRHGYDRRGLPESVTLRGHGGVDTVLAENDRRVAGNVHTRTSGSQTRTWTFDTVGRVVTDIVALGAKKKIAQELSYFSAGDVATASVSIDGLSDRAFTYDYDTRHQLVGASDQTDYDSVFEYGDAGRLETAFVSASPSAPGTLSRSVDYEYTASDPEAVETLWDPTASASVANYVYDTAGNVIKRSEPAGKTADTWIFRYDGDNEQRQVTAPDGRSERYFYDHLGTRTLAITYGAGGTVERVRWWFGATEIWYEPHGSVDKTWAHASLGLPVARIENGPTGTIEYSYHSVLGHLLGTTVDGATLNTAFSYTPFGEILEQTGDVDNHLRRFNGKELDELSALSYYGFRYYDRLSMSWTQVDPLYRFAPDIAYDQPRRMNVYGFVMNNPMVYVDPDGRDLVEAVWTTCDEQGHDNCDQAREKTEEESTEAKVAGTSADLLLFTMEFTPWGRLAKNGAEAIDYIFGEDDDPVEPTRPGIRGGANDRKTKSSATNNKKKKKKKPKDSDESKEKPARGCFVAGTPVLTSAGPLPIESIEPGDFVLSHEEGSGTTQPHEVLAVMTRHNIEIYRLMIETSTGDRSEQLETTAEHPFWVVGSGWVTVADLVVGDQLLSAMNEVLVVASIEAVVRKDTVYNVEVATYHTYFVGSLGVLVHNKPAVNPKIASQIEKAGLPQKGDIPFKPSTVLNKKGDPIIEKATIAHGPKQGKRGYVDQQGRIWVRDRAHGSHADHWDVQIDGGKTYINVGMDGNFSH